MKWIINRKLYVVRNKFVVVCAGRTEQCGPGIIPLVILWIPPNIQEYTNNEFISYNINMIWKGGIQTE